ncbi:MAG: single-stranded-DNA-specific exonuclease RecJ [Hyphomicrobiales bacterium]
MSENPHFLNVSQSVSGRAWQARAIEHRDAKAMAERHDLPELLSRVLAGRGVGLDEVGAYLNPTLRSLMPRSRKLADLEKGSERIAHGVLSGERIAVIGDYDVDGMSSSALLHRFFRSLGCEPLIYIPDRLKEGYGPNRKAVETLKNQGARLLITVDCGTGAHESLTHAASLGLDTVIVDHHQADAALPQAHAVINPNRHDDLSGLGALAAVGVTFILVAAIRGRLRDRGYFTPSRPMPDLLQWLDLTALGTVCDVVPLIGLNRAYVAQGFKVMGRRINPGLAALADVAGLRRRPDPYAAGFILGPRINAAGRLGRSDLGVKLLTTGDSGEAALLARALESLNRQRQDIEAALCETAFTQARTQLDTDPDRALVFVHGQNWHPGVLGLVASRLKQRFARPAIAITHYGDGSLATGSGRSVRGVDLGCILRSACEAGLALKAGGHAMAGGLTVEAARLGKLDGFLQNRIAETATEPFFEDAILTLDGALAASAATTKLVELLDRAGPFGAGNPPPVFAFPAHHIRYGDLVGKNHVKCRLATSEGTSLKAIAFRALGTPLGEMLLNVRDRPVHIAGRLAIDDWGGARTAQLFIDDAAMIA